MKAFRWLAGLGAVLAILAAGRQVAAYDFSGLTALAEGALAGENVAQKVSGFEIRLLKRGVPLYHQAFGDWSLDRPANADSSSKTMSGALVMSVVDSGKGGFSLESRLGDFLSEYDTPEFGAITIRQAFSHTSGISGEDAGSLLLLNPFITLREAARRISETPLAHGPPGSTFAYGGLSMQATGAAMEVATGERYVDLFAERIAGPLQLQHTEFVIASDSNPRVAGGIESTASDYSRFMDMLANDGVDRTTGARVLSAAAVAEMLRRQTTDEQPIANSPVDNNRYGIGVWIDQLGQAGPTVDAIAGGARGFHSWIDQSQDLVFTFATDVTSFQNVEVLSSLMHAAILESVGLEGDYDRNGVVDAIDYSKWQANFGESVTPFDGADGNGDGVVNAADYTVWRDKVGTLSPIATVPEPHAIQLLFPFWILIRSGCRKRCSSCRSMGSMLRFIK